MACERLGGQPVDGCGIGEIGDQLVDRRAVLAAALGGCREPAGVAAAEPSTAPRRANSSASPAPIPDDAPVIRTATVRASRSPVYGPAPYGTPPNGPPRIHVAALDSPPGGECTMPRWTTSCSRSACSRVRSSLSIKTLRAYHESGILVPARVDPQTGYRSYTVDQLADAAIVQRLRVPSTSRSSRCAPWSTPGIPR